MKNLKEFLSKMVVLVLTCVCFFFMHNVTGYAADDIYVNVDDVVFKILSDGTAVLTDGSKASGNYEIPSKVSYDGKEYTVTTIGEMSFYGNTMLEKLVMPDTIKKIDDPEEGHIGAFEDCTSLKEVIFSNNLEYIGGWAFNDCLSLCNVVFPESLNTICSEAFDDCISITSIELPASVVRVDQHAFSGTSIKSFRIPATAEVFSEWALVGIHTLESVVADDEHLYFDDSDGVLYTKGYYGLVLYPEGKKGEIFTVHKNTTTIYGGTFYANEYLKTLVLNESMEINSFSTGMLQKSYIEAIEVPSENPYLKSIDGVLYTKDGENLLFYPPAKKDKIFFVPDGVKEIGYNSYYYSFEKCKYLEELYIPSSVDDWNGNIWYSANLKKVVFAYESQLTVLDGCIFQECESLESICLPKSLRSFSDNFYGNEFYDCYNLKTLYIAQGAPFYSEGSWGVQSLSGCGWGDLTVYGHGKDNRLKQMAEEPYWISSYVDISDGIDKVLGVTFSNTVMNLEYGDSKKVEAVVYPENIAKKELSYVSSNPSVVQVSSDGTVTAVGVGSCYITATAKDKNGEYARCLINVSKTKEEKPLSITAQANSSCVGLGEKITITANATGGYGNYKYSFILKNTKTGKWARIANKISENSYTWTAGSDGAREFYVEVTDIVGKTVRSSVIKIDVIGDTTLSAELKASTTKVSVGDKVEFTAIGKEGEGSYKYSYIVHNKTTGKWARLANKITSDTFTWEAKSAGTRIFYVDVTDADGKTVRSNAITVETEKQSDLNIKVQASVTEVSVGADVTITGNVIDGDDTYTYSFLVHNKTTNKWHRFKFSSSNILTWKATSKGARLFYVEVKDKNGKVVRSEAVTVTVK